MRERESQFVAAFVDLISLLSLSASSRRVMLILMELPLIPSHAERDLREPAQFVKYLLSANKTM